MRRLSYFVFLALVVFPVVAVADDVYLKGAGSISGRIVEQTNDVVKVDIGGGIMGVPMSQVDRIVKGRTPLDDYDERVARLKPGDVNGWKNLGNWASQKGLTTQSRQAYQKVIALAPDDAEARDALGFVKLEGRWVTEEESYRALGYVKYDNEWMTVAEAQLARQAEEADRAARAAERRETEAAIAALQAEDRAREEEERKREEEEERRDHYPVYWGGWGYGVNSWPATTNWVY